MRPAPLRPLALAALALFAAAGCRSRFVSERMDDARPHLATHQEVVGKAVEAALAKAGISALPVSGKTVTVEVAGVFFHPRSPGDLLDFIRGEVELALAQAGAKVQPPGGYVLDADGKALLRGGAPPADFHVLVLVRQAGGNVGHSDWVLWQSKWVEASADLRIAAFGRDGGVTQVQGAATAEFRLAMQIFYALRVPTAHHSSDGFFNLLDFFGEITGL